MSTADALVVALVVGTRFVAPMFILRFPLPAILVCLDCPSRTRSCSW
ncbi:hypothetical protein [Nocardioides bigeumensis]